MEALLRRPRNMTTRVIPPPPPETAMRFGVLAIDLGLREVTVNGRVVPLTRIEFDLLAELCRNPRSVRARTELLHEVWGHEWVGDTHVVDVHMSNLRRKLHHHAPGVQFVQTVRGIGFRLADDLLRPPALAGSHD
jgi:two-component system OmpR family response regulator